MRWERGLPEGADAGFVRPYALTGGRTRSPIDHLPVEAMVSVAADAPAGPLRHEAERIVAMCVSPMSLIEVADRLEVPVGVARVLVGDLLGQGHLVLHRASPIDAPLLQRVLAGLEAL